MTGTLRALLQPHRGQDMGGLTKHPRLYDAVARWLTLPLYRRVLADLGVLAPPAGTVVADVGSGPGRLALQVATHFPDLRVAGIDRSPEMVAESRRAARRRSDLGDRLVFHEADVAALSTKPTWRRCRLRTTLSRWWSPP